MRDNAPHDSTNLIAFLWNWRKTLIMVGVLAAIVSSVVALVIPEKFKSSVVMYPTTTASVSKALIATQNFTKLDNQAFGEEEEAEQLLQILESDRIRDRIREKYDLMKHYDIDVENDDYPYTLFQREWEDNVTFRRNEYMAVEVHVLDKSPDTAMLIARDIAALLDTVKNNMLQERAREAFSIVETEYNSAVEYVRQLEDSLRSLGRMGVFDYEEQSAMYSQEYAKAIASGNQRAITELEKKMEVLGNYGGAQMALAFKLEYETDKLSLLKNKYDEARVDATAKLSHKFIVIDAAKPEKKAYPIRWLIVVISVLSALLLTIVAIITLENIRQVTNARFRAERAANDPLNSVSGRSSSSSSRSRGGSRSSSSRSSSSSSSSSRSQSTRSRGTRSKQDSSKKDSPKKDSPKKDSSDKKPRSTGGSRGRKTESKPKPAASRPTQETPTADKPAPAQSEPAPPKPAPPKPSTDTPPPPSNEG